MNPEMRTNATELTTLLAYLSPSVTKFSIYRTQFPFGLRLTWAIFLHESSVSSGSSTTSHEFLFTFAQRYILAEKLYILLVRLWSASYRLGGVHYIITRARNLGRTAASLVTTIKSSIELNVCDRGERVCQSSEVTRRLLPRHPG